jgi:hypothetical protein
MYSLSPLTAKFAGGLGMVLYSDLNEVFARTETFELIYYRKANGETWGTYGIMTGINEAKNKIELNVFPNPAINQLHITSAEATDKTVSIYSVNGSQTDIVTSMNSKASIDISKLPPAIYFVQVQSNDGIGRYKFMKQ